MVHHNIPPCLTAEIIYINVDGCKVGGYWVWCRLNSLKICINHDAISCCQVVPMMLVSLDYAWFNGRAGTTDNMYFYSWLKKWIIWSQNYLCTLKMSLILPSVKHDHEIICIDWYYENSCFMHESNYVGHMPPNPNRIIHMHMHF